MGKFSDDIQEEKRHCAVTIKARGLTAKLDKDDHRISIPSPLFLVNYVNGIFCLESLILIYLEIVFKSGNLHGVDDRSNRIVIKI